MALLPQALTTLASVKRMLGIPYSVTTDDGYLEDLINAATISIEEYCGRKFVRRNYTGGGSTHSVTGVDDEAKIIFSGNNTYKKVLKQYPISSVGFVLEELQDRVNAVEDWDILTENEDYILDRDIGVLTMLKGWFERGDRNYRVTMAAGYQSQDEKPWVPHDLEHCCKVMVRESYKESERLSSEKTGDISRTFDMTKHRAMVEKTLERYCSDANFY